MGSNKLWLYDTQTITCNSIHIHTVTPHTHAFYLCRWVTRPETPEKSISNRRYSSIVVISVNQHAAAKAMAQQSARPQSRPDQPPTCITGLAVLYWRCWAFTSKFDRAFSVFSSPKKNLHMCGLTGNTTARINLQ